MKLFIASAFFLASSFANAASIPVNLEFRYMNAPAGTMYKMADHPNSVFVFEAFQNFCGDCQKNAPQINALSKEYENNPRVQILDEGLDKVESEYTKWISRNKPNHPVLHDGAAKVFSKFKVADTIPQLFVVNCLGQLVGVHDDVLDRASLEEVRGYIAKALETTCTPAE